MFKDGGSPDARLRLARLRLALLEWAKFGPKFGPIWSI